MRPFRPLIHLARMTGPLPPSRPSSTSTSARKRSASPEVSVLDDANAQTPKASEPKKPRLSTTMTGDTSAAKAKNLDVKASTAKAVAPAKKLAGPTVKKAIFMPGCTSPSPSRYTPLLILPPPPPSVGPKPTDPVIPASLRANLSVPLTSTASETAAEGADTATIKQDFIEALPQDLKELLAMEIETMGDDWFVALRGEFVKPYFREVRFPFKTNE